MQGVLRRRHVTVTIYTIIAINGVAFVVLRYDVAVCS